MNRPETAEPSEYFAQGDEDTSPPDFQSNDEDDYSEHMQKPWNWF